MRSSGITLAFASTVLLSLSSAHAAAAAVPTAEQIQAAVNAGVAKSTSSVPVSIRIESVVGCRASPEVQEETVCLVGMSAGMREGFAVLPLRLDGATWTGVERTNAQFPGPTPDQAKAALTAWAADQVAARPELANDEQIRALPDLVVKSVERCKVERSNGHLHCATTIAPPGKEDVKQQMKFVLDSGVWHFERY